LTVNGYLERHVENPYAAPNFASALNWSDETKEVSCLVAELDCGLSPAGVLVVREAKWQRAIGVVLGFLVGIPASFAVTVIAWRFGDIASALLFSVFAVVPLCGGVWLLNELLSATYFYVALDANHFVRRRGPSQLIVLPLDELDVFDVRVGTLVTYHQPSHKQIRVMKNAYAPEDINAIGRRMNAWCKAPPQERVRHTSELDLQEAHKLRTRGNQQIAWALRALCLVPFLLVLSAQSRTFNAGPLAILLWSIFAIGAFLTLVAGIVRRITAKSKEKVARRLIESS
jgi:hypothetical protein